MQSDFFFFYKMANDQIYFSLRDKGEREFSTHLYYPEIFETKSERQIRQLIASFNISFLTWSLTHKKLMRQVDPYDYQVASSRITNLVMTNVLYAFIGFSVLKIARRNFNPLLLEYLLPAKFLKKTRFLSYVWLVGVGFAGIRKSYMDLKNDTFLFCNGLKYKDLIANGQFVSPNCESHFSKIAAEINGLKID